MSRNSLTASNKAVQLTSQKHLTRLQVEGQVVYSARAEDAAMHHLPASYAVYRRGCAEEGAVGCYEDVSSMTPPRRARTDTPQPGESYPLPHKRRASLLSTHDRPPPPSPQARAPFPASLPTHTHRPRRDPLRAVRRNTDGAWDHK